MDCDKTDKRGRADARHHDARRRRAAERLWRRTLGLDAPAPGAADAESGWALTMQKRARAGARYRDLRTSCSCAGCGNPRRHENHVGGRLTMPERRACQDAREQLREAGVRAKHRMG